jgi:hypothetical protein
MTDHADLIVQYFNYLITEYGFHIVRKEFDSQTMGNAVVIFKSSQIGIEIVVDRNQVLISLGDLLDQRRDWFEFSDVLKYYAPLAEKAYIFPEKTVDNTWDDVVLIQLDWLAIILRQYCDPLLKGEPWVKEEIQEIAEKRAAEMLKKWFPH